MTDLRQLIGNTLRIGVTVACIIGTVGGIIYLMRHGADPIPDYTAFAYGNPPTEYTTLTGIIDGVFHFTAAGWIQLGVIALILTPILRIALSFVDFLRERDWLYAAFTAVVLAVIIGNSIEGF